MRRVGRGELPKQSRYRMRSESREATVASLDLIAESRSAAHDAAVRSSRSVSRNNHGSGICGEGEERRLCPMAHATKANGRARSIDRTWKLPSGSEKRSYTDRVPKHGLTGSATKDNGARANCTREPDIARRYTKVSGGPATLVTLSRGMTVLARRRPMACATPHGTHFVPVLCEASTTFTDEGP